jgi:hypothetical protein
MKEADGVASGITFIITEVNKICCSKGPQAVHARPSGQGRQRQGTASRKEEGEVVESELLGYATVETEAEHLGRLSLWRAVTTWYSPIQRGRTL